ncbi:hypothetical protein [Mesorhizobium sp. C372A]|nr:hypothetical protein [Mesorhizobium sp. C372A]WJI88548.1 hypothetical protein NLY42_06940 [Mesorhizobium sp. C372A]
MSFFIRKISRRTIVQALIAMPALQLFRKQPDSDRPRPIPTRSSWSMAGS